MLTYEPVTDHDREALADLRAEAMEESLSRLGRFDRTRARQRFITSFDPANSRHLLWHGERAGLIVVKRGDRQLTLENLYLYRRFHRLGIGSAALGALCADADRLQLPIAVIVLKDSDAIRLYERFDFRFQQIDDVDCSYLRLPQPTRS